VLVSTRGYSNPDVESIYGRARALCPQVGNDRLLYSVLSGLHLFHQSRAELAVCAELADRRRAFARRLDDPTLEMHVLETVGTVAFWRGQHEVAVVALRDAQSRYNPDIGRAIRLMYGTDSRVVCEAYEAQSLWYLGYPEQARRRALAAVESARAIGDVHSLTLALVFSANVSLNRGELESARRLAEEAVARSTEQHLAQWLGSALFVNGLVLVRLGRLQEGFASMSEGATVHRSVGASVGARYFAASMGEAYLQAGLAAQGLQALAAVGQGAAPTEDTFHDADLSRVYGELLLAATGDTAGATAAIEAGLALARAQGARGLELRTATSLARLWRAAGRTAEARALLAPIWESFTEGHDTSDARAATGVLSSLAGA
jgi:adenylate cyclase